MSYQMLNVKETQNEGSAQGPSLNDSHSNLCKTLNFNLIQFQIQYNFPSITLFEFTVLRLIFMMFNLARKQSVNHC